MFVIMVYDVEVKRVGKVLKTARKHLYWVQNSVLEGNINESSYKKLKLELSQIIDSDYDSVIYILFEPPNIHSVKLWELKRVGKTNFCDWINMGGKNYASMQSGTSTDGQGSTGFT